MAEDEADPGVECTICKKMVIISKDGSNNLSEMRILNFTDEKKQTNMIILCSTKCASSLPKLKLVQHCVVCGKKCNMNKWNVFAKFVKLGGWLSEKAICSETCRKAQLQEAFNDSKLELHTQCNYCRRLDKDINKHCSVCKVVYYCDVECQKKDWPNHKPHCK